MNLLLNFAFNSAGGNISIGGHIGGLIGGIIVTLSFARWGRGHAAYEEGASPEGLGGGWQFPYGARSEDDAAGGGVFEVHGRGILLNGLG